MIVFKRKDSEYAQVLTTDWEIKLYLKNGETYLVGEDPNTGELKIRNITDDVQMIIIPDAANVIRLKTQS